jgi:3-hydroxyacyl-[acyl-carrier-protein] dehydratase
MHFSLLDRVLERGDNHIVTLKLVSSAEEYLQDHFATFPVLPGVLMLEAMVQAARELCSPPPPARAPLVLGGVRALKYGAFVPPGCGLRVRVERLKAESDILEFRGESHRIEPDGSTGPVACSGRFSLRAARAASARNHASSPGQTL